MKHDSGRRVSYPRLDEATKKLNGRSSRDLREKIKHLLEVISEEDDIAMAEDPHQEDVAITNHLDDERKIN